MKGFADWASRRPLRIWLLTVLCLIGLPFLAPLAPALLALNALRHGPAAGVLGFVITIGFIAAVSQFMDAEAMQVAVIMGVMLMLLLPAVAGGALLSWSRDFSFTYQSVIVGSMLVVLAVFGLWPQAEMFGSVIQNEWTRWFTELGFTPEQTAEFATISPAQYVSALLGGLFIVSIAALILGFWWFGLIRDGIGFGAHFRGLRLGRYVSILLMVVVTLAQIVAYPPLQHLGPLALGGFLFPGLAVMHARARNDNWHIGVPILVYVLLFFLPTTGLAVMALSAAGLLDNFFNLRGRAGSDD